MIPSNSDVSVQQIHAEFQELVDYVTGEESWSRSAHEAEFCSTDESYDESITILDRILGISLSKQALETGVREDAVDVEPFYEQKAVPSIDAEGTILVAQADGKGVLMVRDEPAPRRARRGKGQKRTKKKEAVVTSMYTIAAYPRTPQQVTDALMQDASRSDDEQMLREVTSGRPVPIGKEVRATLEGKEVAFAQLAHRVEQRDSDHITHRVALTDGAPALQRRMREMLPTFRLVLDIIHATEYLWSAANALFGETHPERTPWVREHLLHLLNGNTSIVIQTLQERKQDASLSAC